MVAQIEPMLDTGYLMLDKDKNGIRYFPVSSSQVPVSSNCFFTPYLSAKSVIKFEISADVECSWH